MTNGISPRTDDSPANVADSSQLAGNPAPSTPSTKVLTNNSGGVDAGESGQSTISAPAMSSDASAALSSAAEVALGPVAEIECKPKLEPSTSKPSSRQGSSSRLAFYWNHHRWPIRLTVMIGCLVAGFKAWEHSPAGKKRRSATHEVPLVLDDVRNHAPTSGGSETRHFSSLADPFATFANDGKAPHLKKPATNGAAKPGLTVPPLFLTGNTEETSTQGTAGDSAIPIAKVPRGAWLTGTIEVNDSPTRYDRTVDQTSNEMGPQLLRRE